MSKVFLNRPLILTERKEKDILNAPLVSDPLRDGSVYLSMLMWHTAYTFESGH